MTRAWAVFASSFRQETLRLVTRPWDAFVAFGLPLILMVLIAAMLGEGVMRQAPVAVVDEDQSVFSRAAIRNMEATPGIRVTRFPDTMEDAARLMRRGEVYSVARFPPGFSAAAFRRPEQISVSFNGAFQTVGALAALNQSAAIASAATPRLETRAHQAGLPAIPLNLPEVSVSVIGNPQLSFELFLGALLFPGVLHLLAACSSVLAIGRLMQGGSFKDFSARVEGRTVSGLIGTLAPHFAVFTLWGLAWIAWLAGFRGWGIAGSLPLLVLGVVALMAVSVALSAFLVSVMGDTDMAFSATALYAGAAIAFSNGTLPLDHGPRFTRIWSEILPYTHYLRLQTGQWVTGAVESMAWRELAILSLIAVGAMALAAAAIHLRARREPQAKPLNFPLPEHGVLPAFFATFGNLPRARPVSSLLVLAVVLYAFYYPAAYSGQTATGLPVAVVSSTQSAVTRRFVEALDATRAIDVAAVAGSPDEARELMRRGRVDGVVFVPEALEADVVRGVPDGMAIWLNGGYLVRVTSVAKAVASAAQDVAQSRLESVSDAVRAVRLVPSLRQDSLFNPSEGYGDYAVPAVALVILQQTLLMGSAVIAALRRETFAAPLARSARLGVWLALTVIGTAACLFYFGFVFWFQNYPRGGNLPGVILLAPVFSAGVSALGLLLGGLFDRHERVLQVLVGTSAPLFFLAGSAWPHFMMPDPLVWLAHLSPSTAAVQAFVRLNAMGASLGEVGLQAGVLAGLAALYGGAWMVSPRRRPRREAPRV